MRAFWLLFIMIFGLFATWLAGWFLQASLSKHRIDTAFQRGEFNAVFLTREIWRSENYSPPGQRLLRRAKFVWVALPIVWVALGAFALSFIAQ